MPDIRDVFECVGHGPSDDGPAPDALVVEVTEVVVKFVAQLGTAEAKPQQQWAAVALVLLVRALGAKVVESRAMAVVVSKKKVRTEGLVAVGFVVRAKTKDNQTIKQFIIFKEDLPQR